MPPPRALRLSFSPASNPYRVARKDRGRIYREAGRQKMSDLQNAETRRRLPFSLSLLFCFPSPGRPQTIYQGFRFESCGLSFRVRARPIFFTIFFFSLPFFTPRARAGFIEFIPKITPYNLAGGIARMRISRGLF